MDDLSKNDVLQRVGEAFVAVEKKGTLIENSTWKHRVVSLEQTASRSSKNFMLCFREHGSSAKSRRRFNRLHTIYINQIFAISTKTREYGVEYVIPILQILTGEKVYYLKMRTVPDLSGWVAALKVVVSTSTNVPSDQALYHMLIPPKQPIREGDTLLRIERDSSPPCVVFEDPITCKVIHRINLTSVISFGTIMKFNQGWLQLSTESQSSGSSDQDSANGIRIYFQCSMLVDFTLALKTQIERAIGSSFRRRSNTFRVEFDDHEEGSDDLSSEPSPPLLNNTYTKESLFAASTSFDSPWSPYQVPSCSSSEEESGSGPSCVTSSSHGGSGIVLKWGIPHQDEKGKEWTQAFKDVGEIRLVERLSEVHNSDDDVMTFSRDHDAPSGQPIYRFHTYQTLAESRPPLKHYHDSRELTLEQELSASPLISPSAEGSREQGILDDRRSLSSTLTMPSRKPNLQRTRHRYVNDPLPAPAPAIQKELQRATRLNSDSADSVFAVDPSARLVKISSRFFDRRNPSFEFENINESLSDSQTPSPVISDEEQESLLLETSEVLSEENQAQPCETLEDSGYMLMAARQSRSLAEGSYRGHHGHNSGMHLGRHSSSLLLPIVSFSSGNNDMGRDHGSSSQKSKATAMSSLYNASHQGRRFPRYSPEAHHSPISDKILGNPHFISQRPCTPPKGDSPLETARLLPLSGHATLKHDNPSQMPSLASLPDYATLLPYSDNLPVQESHRTPLSSKPRHHPAPRRPVQRSKSLPRCFILRCSSDDIFQGKGSLNVPPKSKTPPASLYPREEKKPRQSSSRKLATLSRKNAVRGRRHRDTSTSSQSPQSPLSPSESKTFSFQRNVKDQSPGKGTWNTKQQFELALTEPSWV